MRIENDWSTDLMIWFESAQRPMPWRKNPSAYYTLVSEIMLQQTQVATVIPYFNRFISRFPSIHALADADLQAVLKLWEGLGYYSRARNLHRCAKILVNDYSATIPASYEELQTLPGIGPYIAAAISSIAFEHPIPVVDGNVLRVFSRFCAVADDIRDVKVRNYFFEQLTPVIQRHRPSVFNQAIMELGALVCTPKLPHCVDCPISTTCLAKRDNKVSALPYKSALPKPPHYHIGVGIIFLEDKILIAKRDESKMLGGLWEFPGGKQHANESIESTVIREILEESQLNVAINRHLISVKHAYTHFKITLHAYLCRLTDTVQPPYSASDQLFRWVSVDELDEFPFPTANKKVIFALRQDACVQQLPMGII